VRVQSIEKLLSDSYHRAKEILTVHQKEHKALAEALYEHETLTADEVRTIVNGGTIERIYSTESTMASRGGGRKRRPRPTVIEIQVD
jgi:cell division protease FtsH